MPGEWTARDAIPLLHVLGGQLSAATAQHFLEQGAVNGLWDSHALNVDMRVPCTSALSPGRRLTKPSAHTWWVRPVPKKTCSVSGDPRTCALTPDVCQRDEDEASDVLISKTQLILSPCQMDGVQSHLTKLRRYSVLSTKERQLLRRYLRLSTASCQVQSAV